MCGIAGYISRAPDDRLRVIVQRMTDAVSHRGPDGEGIFVEGTVALGHRRLAIIDLSEFGAQPMVDTKSGCVIVYNGEIYNYIEIRGELPASRCRFHSQSDTEVILKAYEVWGADCVSRFNGMWAFAIYDRRRNVVFCSRDRLASSRSTSPKRPAASRSGRKFASSCPCSVERSRTLVRSPGS